MRTWSRVWHFLTDCSATVAVIGALSLSCLIGISAFAVDINRGLQQRVVNQRVADVAALAAALAYNANQKTEILTPTARDLARVNGLSDATIDAKLLTDVPTPGEKAVQVTVTTYVPLMLARGMGLSGSYPVTSSATARLKAPDTLSACILGLAANGDAISTSGGATIDATNCAVAGVGNVANGGNRIAGKNIVSGSGSIVNQYGTITADAIRYAVDFVSPSWNNNVPPASKRTKVATAVTDPLKDNPEITAARALLGSYDAPANIANPTTPPGEDWVFNNSPAPNVAHFRRVTGEYVVPAGTYTIGALRVEGGINVTFSDRSTITIARGVTIGGGSPVNFGNNDIKINGGFDGGNGVSFGNGPLSIGTGKFTLSGTNRIGDGAVSIAADLALSGGTTLTIGKGAHSFRSITIGGGSWLWAGPGNTDVVAGIDIGGDSTLALGDGNYRFGRATSGRSIALAGSAVMIMGDGTFSAAGSIASEGGSRLVFGRTANHLINGDLLAKGAVLFGAGRYTIAGDLVNGTGGTKWPYPSKVTGQTYGSQLEGVATNDVDLAGVNVTFVLSGTLNLGGGARSKLLTSPGGTTAGTIASLLVDSATSTATSWGGGSDSIFSGAVHLPNSDVTMTGGNSTQSAGQCFMLIANRITASGGSTSGSTCVGLPGGGGGGSGGGSNKVELIG